MAINDFFVWGSGGEKLTPEQVKRQQMQAQALQQAGADFSPAGHWSVALGRGLSGFMGGFQDRRARDAESAGIASANEAFNNSGIADLLMGGGGASGVTTPQVGGGASQTPLPQNTASGAGGSFLSAIDKTEGGGNYDTLFGHAQKGGLFGNVRVSQMPISEVIAFASPSGQYGQSVKGKVGHVATPMGRYQIVGSTLKQAAKEMGLDPSTPFSPQVQDAMATHIAKKAIAGKSDSQAINALRNTWEGFKSVPDSQMVSILGELRGSKAPSTGVQVASADPNFMPDVASREIPLTALQPSPVAEALATQPQQPQATAAPASQPNPVSEALLAQNDMALGGALALDAGAGTGQQAGFPQPPQQRSAPNMAAILRLANNSYLNDTQKTILGSVLQQQMQANDPLRALQIQQAQQGLTKGELEIAALRAKPTTKYGFTTLPDGTVIRTNDALGTAEPIYEGTPKPTPDVQNYEYAANNPGFAEYQQQLKRAGAQTTNINTGSNSSKFVEESDKSAASRMNDYVVEGGNAVQLMSDMEQLLELGSIIGTGKEAEIKSYLGPYAEMFGINIANLGEAQAFKSITDRLAPQMRPAGAGSSSDTDVKMYLNALPNLRNSPDGNIIIANTMRGLAQNKIEAAEIAAKAQVGEITWQEAEKQIRALPNPYENFKRFQRDEKPSGNKTKSGVTWSVN